MNLTPNQALEKFNGILTPFEEEEIRSYETVHTLGDIRISVLNQVRGSEGFYKVRRGEQIAYRYKVLDIIGTGTFGLVTRCIDCKEQREVALKVCINDYRDENASNEISIFKKIKMRASSDYGLVKMLEHFKFRNHDVIVMELLGTDLSEWAKTNPPQVRLEKLKLIARKTLEALQHLNEMQIIHCDLKPENILFTDAS